MYKKTFEIELVLNEGNFNRLYELYTEANKYGLYESFDQFLEDSINFRLVRHITNNAEIQKDWIRYFTDLQQT